jgi:hypothetical protein
MKMVIFEGGYDRAGKYCTIKEELFATGEVRTGWEIWGKGDEDSCALSGWDTPVSASKPATARGL